MLIQQLSIISKTELAASIISLRSDGIIHVEMKEIDREVELTDIKEMTSDLGKTGNEKKLPVLVSLKRFNPITKEASEYSASIEGGRYTIANAILISNFAIRISSNYYIKIFKPTTTTKMFNSEERAI
ncbi:hypothetical protein BH10BAC1_BH10BAC1_01280 [soil metagenome]